MVCTTCNALTFFAAACHLLHFSRAYLTSNTLPNAAHTSHRGVKGELQDDCRQVIERWAPSLVKDYPQGHFGNSYIESDGSSPLERLLNWQLDQARQAEEKFATELMAGTLPKYTRWHLDQMYTEWQSCASSNDSPELNACLLSRKKSLTHTEIKFFDEEFLMKLREILPGIQSVFDFGSGRGDYLKFHHNQGSKHAFGIQPEYMGTYGYYTLGWDFDEGPVQLLPKLPEGEHQLKVMQCAMFGSPNAGVDLVESFEVFEHVPRSLHCPIINILAKLAQRWVVVTMARQGQYGHNHIANRQKADFLSEWAKRGLKYRNDLTMQMLDACPLCTLDYLTKNLLIFEVNPNSVHEINCDEEDQAAWAPYENFDEHLVHLPFGHTIPTLEYMKVVGN